MTDEQTKEQAAPEQPQGEKEQPAPIDWKAESRKWEARAKKSEAAEAELERIKQERMTEQEKAVARAEAAEAELSALKAEAERAKAAREVAKETGVPLELLDFCADREAMERFASTYSSQAKVHSAPSAPSSRTQSGGGKVSNRDAFASFASNLI